MSALINAISSDDTSMNALHVRVEIVSVIEGFGAELADEFVAWLVGLHVTVKIFLAVEDFAALFACWNFNGETNSRSHVNHERIQVRIFGVAL